MIVSFGWTWPAVVAREKDRTRRKWKAETAARLGPGVIFDIWDTAPFNGGVCIGRGRSLALPIVEPLLTMTAEDYRGEGFAWLLQNEHVIPPSATKEVWYPCTPQSFNRWRNSGRSLHVLRFEVLSITKRAERRLAKLLSKGI